MGEYNASPEQEAGYDLLGGEALHVLLLGGARSGKTLQIIRCIIVRALSAPYSTHAIFRNTFSSTRTSLIDGTVPMVLEMCFPLVLPYVRLNQSTWSHNFPNGSRIYYGGLDDKERTDKILGQEHATIYLNECSQISYSARNKAMTRLSQHAIIDQPGNLHNGQALRLKMFYDENPPSKMHWSYSLFVKAIEPEGRAPVIREDYAWMRLNPEHNIQNLPEATLKALDSLPEKLKIRFLHGEFSDDIQGALWTYEVIKRYPKPNSSQELYELLNKLKRVVVSVDPSGCQGEEDKRSDEIGIVVVGLGYDGQGYVLEDLSGHYSPERWAQVVVGAFDKWQADTIVGETNYGGDMVRANIYTARRNVPFTKVTATRGKHVRADPISTLYHNGKIFHVGTFVDMETQMMAFDQTGYKGDRSPDRADAMIWGLTELLIDHVQGDYAVHSIGGTF